MSTPQRIVHLPEELCAAAETRFGAHFSGLEDLLCTVLRELLADPASKMDEAEQKLIEQRLRELGYV